MIVTIKTNGQTASKRTRNRIKENGPEFEIIANTNRKNETLLRSINSRWLGWLPNNEFIIVNILEEENESINRSSVNT